MKPTLTAMTTSAPIARTMSAGTLFMAPPSTSTCPSISIGGNMPGSDIVARIASGERSVIEHDRLRRDEIDGEAAERRRQIVEDCQLLVGAADPRRAGSPPAGRCSARPAASMPRLRPNSIRDGYARASCLRRMFLKRNEELPNIVVPVGRRQQVRNLRG